MAWMMHGNPSKQARSLQARLVKARRGHDPSESEYSVWAAALTKKHPGECSTISVALRCRDPITNQQACDLIEGLRGRLGEALLIPGWGGGLVQGVTILGERFGFFAYLARPREDIGPVTQGICIDMVSVGLECQGVVLGWAEEAGFRLADTPGDDEVQVTFSIPGRDGNLGSTYRYFPLSSLESIAQNYAGEVVNATERAVSALQKSSNGLLVVNGLPGTGKSYLIRAILSELKGYRQGVVCSPPSAFLHNVGLLLEASARHRRSLLILEDVGDLIEFDAASRLVDETANLLNYTEGLLSLLADSIVLVTFNYEVTRVNPALLREGRCLAHIQTRPLEYEHAQRLVGFPIPARRYTLAEVYAMKESGTPVVRSSERARVSGLLPQAHQ